MADKSSVLINKEGAPVQGCSSCLVHMQGPCISWVRPAQWIRQCFGFANHHAHEKWFWPEGTDWPKIKEGLEVTYEGASRADDVRTDEQNTHSLPSLPPGTSIRLFRLFFFFFFFFFFSLSLFLSLSLISVSNCRVPLPSALPSATR